MRSRPSSSAAGSVSAGWTERGIASWYGADFAGLPTASGETFRPERITAAHRTLPLGTVVEVTNERNGRVVRVPVNDRGPFVAGRIVDLSKAAAAEIGMVGDGIAPVRLVVLAVGRNERRPAGTDDEGDPSARGPWVVQAGAFASQENALRLRDRLVSRYPTPYLEEFRGLKRVKFGPYGTRAEADAARDSLGDLGLAGVTVNYR